MPFAMHPHMLRHACGFKLANDGHDMRLCSTTSGTRTSSIRSGTRKWRRIASGTFGVDRCRRRQARHRFPLYHLGICLGLALRQYLLDKLDRALDLLGRHCLHAAGLLDFHFPGHQQDKQFQKYRRLVPHHLLYRLAATATEGGVHFPDGVGVKRMTRAMDVAAKVSSPPPGGPPTPTLAAGAAPPRPPPQPPPVHPREPPPAPPSPMQETGHV